MRPGLICFGALLPNPSQMPWGSQSSCSSSSIVASSITKSPCNTFTCFLNKRPKSVPSLKTVTSLIKWAKILLRWKGPSRKNSLFFCLTNWENTFTTTLQTTKTVSTTTCWATSQLLKKTRCDFPVSWLWIKLTVKCWWKILSRPSVNMRPNSKTFTWFMLKKITSHWKNKTGSCLHIAKSNFKTKKCPHWGLSGC